MNRSPFVDIATTDGFPVPLTDDIRHRAAALIGGQDDKRSYCYALAVLAVEFYCQCMNQETEKLDETGSKLTALKLKNVGEVECYPVVEGESFVSRLRQLKRDRIGDLAVRFNPELTEAAIVGFRSPGSLEWRPLEGFWRAIAAVERTANPGELTYLRPWFDGAFAGSWQPPEVLSSARSPRNSYSLHSKNTGGISIASRPTTEVERGKIIDLQRHGQSLAMFVSIARAKSREVDICVQVYPTRGDIFLPADLKLEVIDERDTAVMQAKSRQSRNIALEFSGDYDEHFSIKMVLAETEIAEQFVI